ncbi:MAG: anhydro-N-acetylmuramic acid kinase [Pseudomonadota bacterium]
MTAKSNGSADGIAEESLSTTKWAIGLMSGTSLDGVDAALLRTDGEGFVEAGYGFTQPYEQSFRDRLRTSFGKHAAPDKVVRDLTLYHAQAIDLVLRYTGLTPEEITVIGFHGQTIHHDAAAGVTVQIGDGSLLAAVTGVPVVDQMRLADMAAGGQGAPLAPAFHAAMASNHRDAPSGFLNIGGVANITYLGARDGDVLPEPVAFDTGPGNALIDDWALTHTGRPFDENGALAAAGQINHAVLNELLANRYFEQPYPKSADRGDFGCEALNSLSPEDGAATLVAFSVESMARGIESLPQMPMRWWTSGGGRHNPQIMAGLRARLAPAVIEPSETIGWAGDMVEAWAFAYLAMRSVKGLPISFPGTTGVEKPITGGRLHRPSERAA